MVIDGTNAPESDLAVAWFDDGDRIRLPSRFVNPSDFAGRQTIDCRLLVVSPGRYRLLTQRQATGSTDLARILVEMKEAAEPGDVLKETESNQRAAILARLLSCVVSPPPSMWRINLPKEARLLAPDADAKFVFILTVAGYIEVWFPDVLGRAASVPISELLL
jgi:hypothetical protein